MILSMHKVVLIAFLSLVLLCMVPIMGGTLQSGHLHHSNSASCATCMAFATVSFILFLLSVVGIALSTLPEPPRLLVPHLPFHPPRLSS